MKKSDVANIINSRLGIERIEDCLTFPKYFEIETVNMCNARCSMCTVEDWYANRYKKRVMSNDLFQKFVNEVKNYVDWIETICLCRNGEPMLDINIIDRIKKLKDIGIKNINISTNASLINEDTALKLINSGLDEIMFSIDSNKKEVYEKIRIGLNFDEVLENILRFIRLRDKYNEKMIVRIRMVVLEENRDEIQEWLTFWKSKTNNLTDRVYAMPNHFWGRQSPEYSELNVIDGPCISPFGTMIILYNGLTPMCSPDYIGKYVTGNFNESSIKGIWNSNEFNKIRETHLQGNRNKIEICEKCYYWDRKYIE